MHYGLTLPLTGADGDLEKLIELAVLAEEAGWDGIFLEDYIVFWAEGDWPLYDPWLALAAIAQRTHRLRLCIAVSPLSRRRPWKVAREAVTLDHLSHGRFTLGVGLGDEHDASFAGLGEVTDLRRGVFHSTQQSNGDVNFQQALDIVRICGTLLFWDRPRVRFSYKAN